MDRTTPLHQVGIRPYAVIICIPPAGGTGLMHDPLRERQAGRLPFLPIDLKTPEESSHNQDSGHDAMLALVRFLARQAAEEDFLFEHGACSSSDTRH